MELIIAPLFFIAVILYVASPFMRETPDKSDQERAPGDIEKLLSEKADAIDILKDIEMDYRMGKLSDQDYQELKARHEQQAVEVLQQLEKAQKPGQAGKKKKKNS